MNNKQNDTPSKLSDINFSNPLNITYLLDISNDSNFGCNSDNTFIIFVSHQTNITHLVYSTEEKSIIIYNLNEFQIITNIKNAHEDYIGNFRYCFYNNKDILMSISFNNNIKLWDINNYSCLLNLKNINDFGGVYSSCFLNYDKKNIYYIVTSNWNWNESESLKIFDFSGKKIKEIENSNDSTYFIDTYNDKKNSKFYIITGNINSVKSYDFDKNDLFHEYKDIDEDVDDRFAHYSIVIKEFDHNIIKMFESSNDGFLRIWDFKSGILINKINVSNRGLVGICLWNEKYLFIGCEDCSIKMIEIESGNVIKSLKEHKNCVYTVKKIFNEKYGECLISQAWGDDQIKMWVNIK